MYGKTARLVVLLSLIGQTVAAQDKDKAPPKTDPAKTPPLITVVPPAAAMAMIAPPLRLDSIRLLVQQPYAGGGTRASADGRYVALNHPFTAVEFLNPSGTTTILRGTMTSTLYRGSPPETPIASVTPSGPSPTVQQMFDDMPRWAFSQYGGRKFMTGTLRPGEVTSDNNRLGNPLDSSRTFTYNGASWNPKHTVIVEVGVPYTVRSDIAWESDGMTRYFRADMTFRFDAQGRVLGRRMSYPTPPPSHTSRPSVEVRR